MPPSNSRSRMPQRQASYRDVPFTEESDPQTEGVEKLLQKMQVSSQPDTTSVDDLAHALHNQFFTDGANEESVRNLAQYMATAMQLKGNEQSASTSTSGTSASSSTVSDQSSVSKENSEPASNETSRNSFRKGFCSGIRSRSRSRTPRRSPSLRQSPKPSARAPLRSQSPLHRLFRRNSGAAAKTKSATATNCAATANTAAPAPAPAPVSTKPPPTPFSRPTPIKTTDPSVNTPHSFAFSGFVSPASTYSFQSANTTPFSAATTPFSTRMSPLPMPNDTPVSINTPMMITTPEVETVKTGDHKRRNKATTTPLVPSHGANTTPPLPTYNPITSPQFAVNLTAKNKKTKAGARLKRQQTRKPTPDPPTGPNYVAPFCPPAAACAPPTFGAPAQQAFAAAPVQKAFAAAPARFAFSFPAQAAAPSHNVQQATAPTAPFMSPMAGVSGFSMGTSPTAKSSRRRTGTSTNARRRGQVEQMRTAQPSFLPEVTASMSQDTSSSAESSVYSQQSVADKSATSNNKNVDYSGHKAKIEADRAEARDFYAIGEYRSSVKAYTNALNLHTQGTHNLQGTTDDLRAVLLANRAAALLMVGAYEAAADDCNEAANFTSALSANANGEYVFSTDGGPMLRAKTLTRMGRALVKLGKLKEARNAFTLAIDGMQTAIGVFPIFDENNPNLVKLNAVKIDAEAGITDITRCQDSVNVVISCGLNTPHDATTVSRRVNLRALSNINSALILAPGSHDLIGMKLGVLGALNRWREASACCDRLAADTLKFDGIFTHDLAKRNPLPNVPSATNLKPFEGDVKLSSKAIAEVTLRLPPSFQPLYIRALRLEERGNAALTAVSLLSDFLNQFLPRNEHDNYAWVIREKGKLERTNEAKERGDSMFRTAGYTAAIEQYGTCLKIDSEDRAGNSQEVGGRLHAVLHCNRAAAYMAMGKYREAITDCSAALHIHSHYMKAMLRRSRCYFKLNRFDEADTEYERYIGLVKSARAGGAKAASYQNTPCIFDGPHDVKDDDIGTVQKELKEVRRAKMNAENTKRAEEEKRQNRQNFYNETFGQSSGAEQRRQDWYNQESSSRRWDSFSGRGPNRSSRSSPNRGGSYRAKPEPPRQQSNNRQNSWRQEERKEQPAAAASPGSDTSLCHYAVLSIHRNATEVEIKKAYRSAARKYHPDKNKEKGAVGMFRRVQMAYDILKDADLKGNYDLTIRWNQRY